MVEQDIILEGPICSDFELFLAGDGEAEEDVDCLFGFVGEGLVHADDCFFLDFLEGLL